MIVTRVDDYEISTTFIIIFLNLPSRSIIELDINNTERLVHSWPLFNVNSGCSHQPWYGDTKANV